MVLFVLGVCLAPVLFLISFACLCYGFYLSYFNNWVEASTFFLASIASVQMGRYLWTHVQDEKGEWK